MSFDSMSQFLISLKKQVSSSSRFFLEETNVIPYVIDCKDWESTNETNAKSGWNSKSVLQRRKERMYNIICELNFHNNKFIWKRKKSSRSGIFFKLKYNGMEYMRILYCTKLWALTLFNEHERQNEHPEEVIENDW